jgi:IS5 family transposase
MLIAIKAQKPIPLGNITGNNIHIWDTDLKIIDTLLSDDQFVDIIWDSLKRNSVQSSHRGAPRMACNRILRTGVLKHIKDWSFRDVYSEMQRNLDYRAFTQLFDETIPSYSTLSRNIARIDEQAIREMNTQLMTIARQNNVITGRRFRQDTTVCETNIHYPTDSSLLRDGVRVLQRLVKESVAVITSLYPIRDRSRSALHRVLEINRAARCRRKESKKRLKKSYISLLKITNSVLSDAGKIAKKLNDGRVTRHLCYSDYLSVKALSAQLGTMLPRVAHVRDQTEARILDGNKKYPNKLLSLFVPESYVVRKGKAHKPNEFGRLIDIVEVERGFVSDYTVLDGNPGDGSLLIPALERHKQYFGRTPHTIATDRGYWSSKNEKKAYEMGVKRVSIPAKGRLSKLRLRLQRSRWFRRAQRWRANGEGRIAILKNQYGLDRCQYKGIKSMDRWVGWCVFVNNLVIVARHIRKMQEVE